MKREANVTSPLSSSHFSIVSAPSQSIRGIITKLSGDVLWQSRIATGDALLISRPQTIQQGEEIDTGASGTVVVEFPKLVTITESPRTAVEIIQTLPANIVFHQKDGNSIYDVATSSVPVTIRTFDMISNLSQGKYTVSVNKTTDEVTVTSSKGSATVAYTDLKNITKVIPISDGQTLMFNNDTKKAVIE